MGLRRILSLDWTQQETELEGLLVLPGTRRAAWEVLALTCNLWQVPPLAPGAPLVTWDVALGEQAAAGSRGVVESCPDGPIWNNLRGQVLGSIRQSALDPTHHPLPGK